MSLDPASGVTPRVTPPTPFDLALQAFEARQRAYASEMESLAKQREDHQAEARALMAHFGRASSHFPFPQ